MIWHEVLFSCQLITRTLIFSCLKAQKRLRDLKGKISAQSKKNFVLERDVRYLDSRIALLIQNRMALDEVWVIILFFSNSADNILQQREVERTLEEVDPTEGHYPDDRKLQQYSNLFFLLQSEPRHIAALCRLVSLSEIDTLLQTVMFTLYGNQYESREEHLLLTMFQSVLSAQFETATEFGSLLRANTPVSRMMTTYTRRGPGQSYLKSVLAERINSLIEHKDLNLEINPIKVYDTSSCCIVTYARCLRSTNKWLTSLKRRRAPSHQIYPEECHLKLLPRTSMSRPSSHLA
jgi:Ras GTPase-activating-like protein IQGAP2/3